MVKAQRRVLREGDSPNEVSLGDWERTNLLITRLLIQRGYVLLFSPFPGEDAIVVLSTPAALLQNDTARDGSGEQLRLRKRVPLERDPLALIIRPAGEEARRIVESAVARWLAIPIT